MAVGAFMAYNFELRMPWLPTLVSFALAGLCAAAVGIVFGLPSLRIKGFYLAVATLACQFFVLWALQRIGWFTNHSASGVITAQKVVILGYAFDTPATKYMLTLCRRRGARGARQEHAAQRDRAQVHGGARHGPRGRGDRHPDDAAPSCSPSRSARSTAASPARCTRTRTSAPSSRRRSTSICRSGSCSWSSSAASAASSARSWAPRSSRCCRSFSTAWRGPIENVLGITLPAGLMSNLEADRVRRADHLLPDRRAARPRPALADRQGEAAAVAVPALMLQCNMTWESHADHAVFLSHIIDSGVGLANPVRVWLHDERRHFSGGTP